MLLFQAAKKQREKATGQLKESTSDTDSQALGLHQLQVRDNYCSITRFANMIPNTLFI